VKPGHQIDWTKGMVCGVASAALFGLSAPLSKRLLPTIAPIMLAGLLYLGAGAGLTIVARLTRRPWPRFKRADWLTLGVIAAVGGFLSPTLLMFGLQRVSGLVGSLLLNLEAVSTMVFAVTWFREQLNVTEWLGAALIVGGAAAIGYSPGSLAADGVGVLAIAGACIGWGLDNNLTQRVSSYDPVAVVQVKALSAGVANVLLALVIGQRTHVSARLGDALCVGFFCYGISIVLDVYALRLLGAAREAAVFATAPFLGAIAAIVILGERPGLREAVAGLLMAAGIAAFRVRPSRALQAA
jgi:drug/metabolite transporter (DMT)-like permease